ncbi:MAG: cation transporter [Candidatus Niyogibacteria bacterium]|nr:cation transporter [Candidatus Niyogibacteria bacterium]
MTHFKKCKLESDCVCEEQRYRLVLVLSFAILLMEALGGIWSGSLALLADAGHVFADIFAVIVSIVVARSVRGRDRVAESHLRAFGGYVNAGLLLIVAVWVLYEAARRYLIPTEILGTEMFVVAVLGALGNYVQHTVLEDTDHEDRHITHRALSVHVVSDMLQSVAVCIGALVIIFTGWHLADVFLSAAVGVVMTYWSLKLFFGSRAAHNGAHHHDHDYYRHSH